MGRWLAVDYGTKRVGLAVGSTGEGVAGPVKSISAEPYEALLDHIRQVAEEYDVEGIVVGWPLNMDDSQGPQADLSRRFASQLAASTGMDVRLWDERLSSFDADATLAGQLTRAKRKRRQDAIAAAVFLQDFLACGGPDAAPRPDDLQP